MSQRHFRSSAIWICFLVGMGLLGSTQFVSTQGRQGGAAAARPAAPAWPPRLEAPAPGEVEILPVAGNVKVIIGAGANITVQSGKDGVFVVDTGTAAMSDKVIAAIKSISPNPLRYIVNTTHFLDYTGGNEKVALTGEIVPWREAGYTAGPQGNLATKKKASVISFYTVFHRLAGEAGAKPMIGEDGWPDNTYSIGQKRLYFNDEPIAMIHMPGTTDGETAVLFRKSDVVSVGPLLDLTGYPMIDTAAGGNLQAEIDTLNHLISEVAVPAANAAGGTIVIPGHGRLADHAELVYYRDMMTIIRDRIQDGIKRGLTLDQIKAARPTRDYDARYGHDTGPWTTNMFVEASYRSLVSRKS
jgi:glyoxylase-like metal-dependent hydrolase (beta-lactamase superfamily II)